MLVGEQGFKRALLGDLGGVVSEFPVWGVLFRAKQGNHSPYDKTIFRDVKKKAGGTSSQPLLANDV